MKQGKQLYFVKDKQLKRKGILNFIVDYMRDICEEVSYFTVILTLTSCTERNKENIENRV